MAQVVDSYSRHPRQDWQPTLTGSSPNPHPWRMPGIEAARSNQTCTKRTTSRQMCTNTPNYMKDNASLGRLAMICGLEGMWSFPILSPRFGPATRMAVGLKHSMQFDQGIWVVHAPPTSIADHRCEIGNADDMAIPHRKIRHALGGQEAHMAFGARIIGSSQLGHVLFIRLLAGQCTCAGQASNWRYSQTAVLHFSIMIIYTHKGTLVTPAPQAQIHNEGSNQSRPEASKLALPCR